jgi:hypothetical protein
VTEEGGGNSALASDMRGRVWLQHPRLALRDRGNSSEEMQKEMGEIVDLALDIYDRDGD